MDFKLYGDSGAPTLLLIPGLGVSYEIFLPLIKLLEEKFRVIAVQLDGFTMGVNTRFTSVDDQAGQIIGFVRQHCGGRLNSAYGLSLGGKILSRILERNEIIISHAIMDAAPLLPLPKWLVGPLRHYQSYNVWGPVTTGRDSGSGSSTHTISMSFWMNAGKSSHSVADRPYWTVTKTYIPTSWNPSQAPISSSGMVPKKPSLPSRRSGTCSQSARMRGLPFSPG